MAASPAWDEIRPPEPDLIDACVHCGFCLPTCPTYQLWSEEMDSPRGRIVLMREGHTEGAELTLEVVEHFDNCLGCMACVTACPSGVRFDLLITDTRAQVERNFDRDAGSRVLRRAIFELFPHPGRLRALVPALVAGRRLGLPRLAGALERIGGDRAPAARTFAAALGIAPPVRLRDTIRRLPRRRAARGESRGRIGFLQGCVQRVYFGDVNDATVRVLAAEGFDVHAPTAPRCCGALMGHAGEDQGARALARETIARLEGCEIVAVNAAGCGSAMKEYGHLLRDDPEWAERAAAFSERVRDVSEILHELPERVVRHPLPMRVAFHDSCHLAHAQGIRTQPRELLRAIPGLEIVEPAGWEICCGSAGIYNLTKPQPAAELGRRKAEALLATGADAIVSANPGCTLQITAHLEKLGRPLPVYHPMELLHMSMTKGSRNGH
jgi:glycolate oxidase iron-sulfur subunit